MSRNDIYLASKPRYEILDGLRGVAALIIVAFHLFETYSRGPMYQTLNHGYLAVDFFFVLSGFVIGYAYDDRWDRMSTWNFFKRRLVRLHPMVIFGCVFGALLFYFSGCKEFSLVEKTSVGMLLLVMLWCCTIVPLPASMDIRGWAETNPLDGPVWTLQWEYLANILYALVIRRLSKRALTVCVVLFGCMTLMLCLNIDWLGVWEEGRYAAYTVIGGWSLTPDQLLIGVTRLLYPFFMGLLISRVNRLIKVRGGFWWCSLLVAVVLVMPRIGGASQPWLNGIYEAIVILLIFPLVVSMGAGSEVKGRYSTAVCKFFGEVSYPLYITHYPLVYVQKAWAQNHPDAPLELHIAISVSLYLLALLNAYAAYKLYDVPVRRWLKRKLFKLAPSSEPKGETITR
jgi:peptidoglycan/LPS O-acetylase OafA/YrhL